MSLLKRFNPKNMRAPKTKEDSSGTKDFFEVKTEEPQSNIKIEKDLTSQLIDEYKYKPKASQEESVEEPAKEEENVLESSTNIVLNSSKSTFNFFDLILFCEEHLYLYLYYPMEAKVYKKREIEYNYQQQVLELYSNYKEEKIIEFDNGVKFKDYIYLLNGELFLTEELKYLGGFYREYFNYDTAYILYNDGNIKNEKLIFCHFWHKDRLYKVIMDPNYNMQRPEISELYDPVEVCRNCNYTCNFRHSTND